MTNYLAWQSSVPLSEIKGTPQGCCSCLFCSSDLCCNPRPPKKTGTLFILLLIALSPLQLFCPFCLYLFCCCPPPMKKSCGHNVRLLVIGNSCPLFFLKLPPPRPPTKTLDSCRQHSKNGCRLNIQGHLIKSRQN